MKRINYLLFLVFALTISFSSCKKDESTSGEILSDAEKEKQLLTAQSWKISSHIENMVAVDIPDCEKDDIYTFSVNGTFSHNVGALTCGAETNSSGTWSLSLDLFFTFNGAPMGMEITNSKLRLWQSDFDGDISVITTEMTFIPGSPYDY